MGAAGSRGRLTDNSLYFRDNSPGNRGRCGTSPLLPALRSRRGSLLLPCSFSPITREKIPEKKKWVALNAVDRKNSLPLRGGDLGWRWCRLRSLSGDKLPPSPQPPPLSGRGSFPSLNPEILQAISKPASKGNCHSEQSEESRVFDTLRSFTSFRMTRKTGFEMACSR